MRDLNDVINWRRLDEKITLSGQPTEEQLAEIRNLGVTHIVNLGPHSNNGALKDESGSVTALDMKYFYIPVDFENPTQEDYLEFCKVIEELANETMHVHCIYNARVSAFFYRYAKEGKGGVVQDTFALMDGIWRPGGVWAKFISNEAALNNPNKYKGYDY